MTDDINGLARFAYDIGINPVDYAEGDIEALINAHFMVAASRAIEPGTFPGYSIELTTDALARRILGNLLDAGWHPPIHPIPEPEPRESA